MKVLALVISLVIASAASSWAVELPKGRFTIKCLEGAKVVFDIRDLTLESLSAGTLIVKDSRGYTLVILVGGGQCVLVEQGR